MSYITFLVVIVVLGGGGSAPCRSDENQHEPAGFGVTLEVGDITIGSHDGFITIRPSAGDPSHRPPCHPGMRVSPEACVNTRVAPGPPVRIQITIGPLVVNLAVW
jgi:hypothetical protein